ncbi:MAG TPA: hypothetical protein VK435_06365, partial [Thermodesulfovibrionales bacterium]|nr:hypothetical protein [Thermodesulfovibrionales bacterium]
SERRGPLRWHRASFINPATRNFNIVIVRLDRTIQNLLKRLDSPIKSGNDNPWSLCIFALPC